MVNVELYDEIDVLVNQTNKFTLSDEDPNYYWGSIKSDNVESNNIIKE